MRSALRTEFFYMSDSQCQDVLSALDPLDLATFNCARRGETATDVEFILPTYRAQRLGAQNQDDLRTRFKDTLNRAKQSVQEQFSTSSTSQPNPSSSNSDKDP
jgi:hypothetical protein